MKKLIEQLQEISKSSFVNEAGGFKIGDTVTLTKDAVKEFGKASTAKIIKIYTSYNDSETEPGAYLDRQLTPAWYSDRWQLQDLIKVGR